MAEAEQAGIGAFLSSIGSQLEQGRADKKRKHEQWMACIMQGNSAEACSQILGYDPGETARGGAEGLQAERRAEVEREKAAKLRGEREKFGRETAAKHTTIPTEEATALDIPIDWEQAIIRPGGTKTAVGMTQQQLSEAKWKRGAPGREVEKEKRSVAATIAKEKRTLADKKEYASWAQKQGIGEGEPKGPVDTKYILKESSKGIGLSDQPMYNTPKKIDKMVRMWGRNNWLAGADDEAMENAFTALGLPPMEMREGLRDDLKAQSTALAKTKLLASLGFDEDTVEWILENYLNPLWIESRYLEKK